MLRDIVCYEVMMGQKSLKERSQFKGGHRQNGVWATEIIIIISSDI